MQKIKVTKGLYRIVAVLIIILLVSSFFASGLLARYLSTNNDNDTARVAHWDIKVIDKGGETISANQGTTHLDSESFGNSFFQVSNKSEVAATLCSDSKISLKFSADTFKTTTEISSWDFLKDGSTPIDNPIEFNVYIYNCKVSDLDQYLRYTKTVGSTTTTLNLTEYNALSEENKKGYVEDVVLPNDSIIKETKIFSTSDNTLEVTKKIENGIPYFYLTQNLTDAESKYTFPVPVDNDNYTSYTFRVEWIVGGSSNIGGSYDTTFKAFYVIEQSEYNTTDYTGLVSKAGAFTAAASANDSKYYSTVTVEDEGVEKTKTFVIAYKDLDYFEYLIYTSSLGGEPTFTNLDYIFEEIETKSSGIYKTSYSKVTSDDLNSIKSRTWGDSNTYNTVKKYCEKLQADAYTSFLGSRDAFENSLGYLSIGIDCFIIYDLKVVQVD